MSLACRKHMGDTNFIRKPSGEENSGEIILKVIQNK
jgi:hypothetical protein